MYIEIFTALLDHRPKISEQFVSSRLASFFSFSSLPIMPDHIIPDNP
jgi:hypothetical protein